MVDILTFLVGRQDTRGGRMKITRRHLRRLIETTIKPTIPNVPSEELLGRIDNFARDEEMQPDADAFAGSFGYPEDRSYVDDLKTYDAAGRVTFDTPLISLAPEYTGDRTNTSVEQVPIPYELVDEVIRRYKRVIELENQGIRSYDMGRDAHTFRKAAYAIYSHIDEYLDNKYGDEYQLDTYGYEGASGYRAEDYNKAMEHFGEYA